MKPPPFTYHAPRTLEEALRLVAQPNARPLAGGQTLMPMLNMRVVAPEHVVDLAKVPQLSGIREEGGAVWIGAMTRQRDIEFSPLVRERLPLLAEAIEWVGHRQTRNRGTLGGSLCHLDPSAEQPTVAMAMDATLSIAGPAGQRELPMREFAVDLMTTALGENELLTGVRITPWPAGHGWAFVEFARRHGDFAIASAAVLLQKDASGKVARVSLTLGGVAKVPLRVSSAESALAGKAVTDETIEAAARACGEVEALDDPHVPGWYRKRLAATLAARAVRLALSRAR